MTDFDALLKRSFAEAHDEPADDGFSVNVAHGVARRETALKIRNAFQVGAVLIACGALSYGGYTALSTLAPEAMATAGLEVARVHGAISNTPSLGGVAQTLLQTLSAGVTQLLLITCALAGGAVAYRVSQD